MYDESTFPSKCPICTSELTERGSRCADFADSLYRYYCPRCDVFRMNVGDAECVEHDLRNEGARLAVSHRVRRLVRRQGPPPTLSLQMVYQMREQGLPDPDEQTDNLILLLGSQGRQGHAFGLTSVQHLPVIGSRDAAAMTWLLKELQSAGLLGVFEDDPINDFGTCEVTLTLDGWRRYGELQRGRVDSKLAFMAMAFRDDLYPAFEQCFRPAVKATGFTLRRIDEKPPAGSIDERIQVEIRRSRFVVCDLTYDNSGAYWEAGFAKGLGPPVFYSCRDTPEDKREVHFNTRQQQIVFWSPDEPAEAIPRLKDTIRATIPDAALVDAPELLGVDVGR